MDFVAALPTTGKGHGYLFLVFYRLNKCAFSCLVKIPSKDMKK
jgi:hypothetical protein